ncbi:MAG: bifunctional serine/threonine-protein kinase/formylglycine-generating enzyme family protein [Thermoguttaceae bacterium]|jgi:serine/threonine-protein kinase
MSITVEQFIERLTESGLISAQEISSFQQQLPPERRPKDVQQFAQALVQRGKLTKYQAQAVYQGKAKGLVFGEYVVLDKLGEGGMGIVLKAQHRRMKRLVAVKMIAKKEIGSPDAIKRFYREVEAAAKLNHPNIVTAHDASEHEGVHYLVMEYVEGKDLAALAKERGPLPIGQTVDYIVQAARGLQYAHEQGIVHRDIKPSNLLVDKKGTVKILDMGLALVAGLADGDDQDRLTTSGQLMGTCDYMAPEQALDTHCADARADIYSLGCTFYRLLTGHVPYKGETMMQVLMAHRESPIPSLRNERPDAPPQLDAAYQKMVAKEPSDRYQTMTAVITALETCAGRMPASATSSADEPTAAFQAEDHLSFLQEASPGSPATAAKKQVERRAGATLSQHVAVEETSSRGGRADPMALARKKKLLAVGIGLGLLGLVGIIAWAVIVRMRHPDGTETVIKGTDGTKVEVNGQDVTPKSEKEKPAGVKVVGPAPPPAITPFDAKKAKEYQAAWAKYLGVPVEITNSIGMKLVLIPPGEFEMGSPQELIDAELNSAPKDDKWYLDHLPSEGPRHHVRITRPFYLGMYLVTQDEYQRVMGASPSEFSATGKSKDKVAGQDTKRFPVEMVSWTDTDEFCSRLSEMAEEKSAGRRYRLPSEAQWEYACRAGSTGRWFFSPASDEKKAGENLLSDYAWFQNNSGGRPHAVGGRRASPWGLYDIYGNVDEWCQDWYAQDYYAKSPTDNPSGPTGGSGRVLRGGCWDGPGGRAAGRRAATTAGPGPVTSTWASVPPKFWRKSRVSERSRSAARSEGEGRAEAGQAQA